MSDPVTSLKSCLSLHFAVLSTLSSVDFSSPFWHLSGHTERIFLFLDFDKPINEFGRAIFADAEPRLAYGDRYLGVQEQPPTV